MFCKEQEATEEDEEVQLCKGVQASCQEDLWPGGEEVHEAEVWEAGEDEVLVWTSGEVPGEWQVILSKGGYGDRSRDLW